MELREEEVLVFIPRFLSSFLFQRRSGKNRRDVHMHSLDNQGFQGGGQQQQQQQVAEILKIDHDNGDDDAAAAAAEGSQVQVEHPSIKSLLPTSIYFIHAGAEP